MTGYASPEHVRTLKAKLARAEGLHQAEQYRRERVEQKLDRRDRRLRELETEVEQLRAIDAAMVERAARALFEDPSVDGDYTWDDLLREDGPERADLWRADAARIITAALQPEAPERTDA